MKRDRIANDYYPTPDGITNALLKHVQIQGTVFEPCAGHGAIAKYFPGCLTNEPYPSKDFVPHECADATDRQAWDAWTSQWPMDWVVTNPPYGELATLILQNALTFSANVAMLLRLSYLEPCSDRARLLDYYGHNLTHLIVLNPRPQFRKDVKGTDNVTSAWFVWQRGNTQGTQVIFELNWKAEAIVHSPTSSSPVNSDRHVAA